MMKFTQTVALKGVKCFALHGWYPEEQLTGNHFIVDLEVTFVPSGDTEDLGNTVNYEDLNQIILTEMKNTQKLLETVLKNMMDGVMKIYPFIQTIDVSIKKLNPPMLGQIDHSFVKLSYKAS